MEAHITGVQDGRVIFPDLGKCVALIAQQPMHVPNEAQILLVPTRLADGAAPFFYGLEYLHLHPAEADRRTLGEAADELVEELFGANLQLKGVATVLDADIEQVEGEHGDGGVAVVDVVDDGHSGLARGGALFGVDQVGDLEVQGQVGLIVLGAAGGLDEALELGGSVTTPSSPGVPGGRPCAGRLHRDGCVSRSSCCSRRPCSRWAVIDSQPAGAWLSRAQPGDSRGWDSRWSIACVRRLPRCVKRKLRKRVWKSKAANVTGVSVAVIDGLRLDWNV